MYKGRGLDWKEPVVLFLLLFLLLMARNCACGVEYFPQLDDYIQYHSYTSAGSFQELQQTTGLLASRPLAGLADYFLWGPMFDHMIFGVALISLLYTGTALLFWKLLQRYFRLSPLFPVLVTLLPLGVEGTYWMSAATRVVVGMFFAVSAAWAFLRWLDRAGVVWLCLYLPLQLLPFGFYEQAGILSVTLTVGTAILERALNKKGLGWCAVSLWGAPALGLYFLFTRMMSSGGVYSSRAEIILPVGRYYWRVFFPDIIGQLRNVFLKGGFLTLFKGFVRGARLILSGQLVLWALVVLGLCGLFCAAVQRQTEERKQDRTGLAVLSGLLLGLGPVSLFLILGNPWFSLRGAVTSFPGIALVADTLLLWLWDRLSLRREGLAVLAAAAALVFCVAGASEIVDYQYTNYNDWHAAHLVINTLTADGLDQSSGRVGILNLEASYLPDQNFFWHEHIHGCTESVWAFTGLLTAEGGENLPSVTPLPSDPMYRQWNREANHPESFETLYWNDGSYLYRVELVKQKENEWLVQDASGRIWGRIWEEDGVGYIQKNSPSADLPQGG